MNKYGFWPHLINEDFDIPPDLKAIEGWFNPKYNGLALFAMEYLESRRGPPEPSPISTLESIADHWHWYYLDFKYFGHTPRTVPEKIVEANYDLIRIQAVWPLLSDEQRVAATTVLDHISEQLRQIAEACFAEKFADALDASDPHEP